MTAAADLVHLRRIANFALQGLLWLHVPLSMVVAYFLETSVAWAGTASSALAVAASLTWAVSGVGQATRLIVGVALMASTAVLLGVADGHPWQIDVHMYFFAGLALLAAYCDWRVIVVASVTIALHHLALNELASALVYPGGSDLSRVLFHAVIVVLEAFALGWATHGIVALLESRAALSARAQLANERAAASALAAERQAVAARQEIARSLSAEFERSVTAVITEMVGTIVDAGQTAAALSGIAGTSAEQASAIATASQEMTVSIIAVSDAAGRLTDSVSGISNEMATAAVAASEARMQAEQTQATVADLAHAANQIGEVVKLINGIAGKTNLLALNATIEAARAGPAGRGFAVVAGEVKALAAQTARATADVEHHVATIRACTGPATASMGAIAASLTDLGSITAQAAASMQQQDIATREIAAAVNQAAHGSDAIALTLDQLARTAAQTDHAATDTRTVVTDLSERSDRLTAEVTRFVATVQAAA